MNAFLKVVVICFCATLAACTGYTNPFTGNAPTGQEGTLGAGTRPGVAIGGSVSHSMDAFDRTKLNHALDKAPGTTTEWTNENTGTHYAVTPIKKTTVNGNSLCREYRVISTKGSNSQESSGTACVAADGAWSEV